MAKKKIILAGFIIVIVFTIVVFGGAFAYSYFSHKNSGQIAGWKTYKSDKYGFEFQYPPNWSVQIEKQELSGDDRFMVNFPPNQTATDYETMKGYGVILDVGSIREDLPYKNQDEEYKYDLDMYKGLGYSTFKFDFQGEKGVADYLYYPSDATGQSGCATSIGVFHKNYIFDFPLAFGEVIAPEKMGKCLNVLPPSQEFRKVISTFKFTK